MQDKDKFFDPPSDESKNSIQVPFAQAVELFLQGRNFPEIALLLNLSKTHIVRNFPRTILLNSIEDFMNQGLPYETIANRLGIDSKTIISYAKKSGLHDKITKKIVYMFLEGIPISEISVQLQMEPQQVIKWLPTDVKRNRLIELYTEQELPFNEITHQLGISRTSLKNWLRIYKLKRRHAAAGIETKEYPKSSIILDYLRLNSIESIATRWGFPRTTIRRILDEADVIRTRNLRNVRKHVSGGFHLPLNPYLMEVLNGELLGDLSLELKRKNCLITDSLSLSEYLTSVSCMRNFQTIAPKKIEEAINRFNLALKCLLCYSMGRMHLCSSILSLPWILHLKHIFQGNSINLSTNFGNAKSTGSKYHTFNLWSSFTTQFREIYNVWYPKSSKIVPKTLRITPDTLLHWYIGDGSYSTSSILFSTHNFPVTDVRFLSDQLNNILGIRSHIRITKNKTGINQPVLVICRNNDQNILLQYLKNSNFRSYKVAKSIFPWKFDEKLRKSDVIGTESYFKIFSSYVTEYSDLLPLIKQTIDLYQHKKTIE